MTDWRIEHGLLVDGGGIVVSVENDGELYIEAKPAKGCGFSQATIPLSELQDLFDRHGWDLRKVKPYCPRF